MPNTLPPISMIGISGQTLIYNPGGIWQWWSLNDIYLGTNPTAVYVPKVNDYVMDPLSYTAYIVTAVDPITLIPTLVEKNPANMVPDLSQNDILFGVGPGAQKDTYFVYLDKTTYPYVMAVDQRFLVAGSMSSYAKIFVGSTVGVQGRVVSKIYDNSGNVLSENVPLETVAINNVTNVSVNVVAPCSCIDDLLDSEVVTVVAYSDQGSVINKRQMLVENTSFIRSIEISERYIISIGLESVFMSPTSPNVINFPLNIPINALGLIGVVNYSNGDVLRLPVDGTKFTMLGLAVESTGLIASIIGQSIPLTLRYTLASNELSYIATTTQQKYITAPYTLVVINPNNSFTVKLFVYPVWNATTYQYTLQWWLFNLDRNVWFDVTPYVVFNASTGPFNPTAFGYIQQKSVSINLNQVSGGFQPFIHTQIVQIVLNQPTPGNNNAWSVMSEFVNGRQPYGLGLYASVGVGPSINISSGFTDLPTWLSNVYSLTYPLVNPAIELVPPTPTHFIVTIGLVSAEILIADWNTDIAWSFIPTPYTNVNLRFIKRTSTGDLELSIASMLIAG